MASFDPASDDHPLVIIAQTTDGRTVTYLHERLPIELRDRLCARRSQISFPDVDAWLYLLDLDRLQYKVAHSKTYVFPQHYIEADTGRITCFQEDDPKMKCFGFDKLADEVYAVEYDGVIMSTCVSIRQNADSAESWVFTKPEYRRRGLARLVVAAWAKNAIQNGIIPFYSHEIDNTTSAGLASKLELIPVFEEIGIEGVTG
ncbi:MAG: GNAT family N-acetyltransferase [Coprothermobacterota bacterium]|nr:GNAT family N-acetyltransferase [Coprothermobacterota bacterium]